MRAVVPLPTHALGKLLFLKSFFLMLLTLATACAHAPVASPPATQQAIVVSLPASLEPLTLALRDCAANQPGISLFIRDTNDNSVPGTDLNITLGDPDKPVGFAAILADEDIVVVLNQANTLASLSTTSLRDIYSGQITQWGALSSHQGAIQVWDYPVSDPLQQAFDQAVLKGDPVTSMAYLAPSPSAMLEAITSNPQAVGYLPRAWLEGDKVHAIKLEAEASVALRLPVLALAAGEPQGALRTFVACLQTGRGHTIIMQSYQAVKP